jgi:hypothetical protein
MPELEEFVKLYMLSEEQTLTEYDYPVPGLLKEYCLGKKKFGPFTKEEAKEKKKKQIKNWISKLPLKPKMDRPYYINKLYRTDCGLSSDGGSFEIKYSFLEKYIPKSKVSVLEGKIVIKDGGDLL